MARKKNITLKEHARRIAGLGGAARAAKLSPEELSEIGRKGGLVGGTARATKLSAKRRREIAKKAAAARWEKRQ